MDVVASIAFNKLVKEKLSGKIKLFVE